MCDLNANTCKICGSFQLRIVDHTAKCIQCGTLLYYPYPEDASDGDACWNQEQSLRWYTQSAFLNHMNFTHMTQFALDVTWQGKEFDALDYGGGGGQFALVLKSHCPLANVYITDVGDNSLLNQYKPLNKQIPFHSFNTDSTRSDAIFLNDVFEHVADPSSVLKLLMQKLNDGGQIFIDTPKQFWIYPVTRLLSRKIHSKLLKGTVSRMHLQIWSKASFQAVVRNAGLRIVKYKELSEFTMPADYYMRNMGIQNPLLKLAGRALYSSARFIAKNKIAALLEKA